MIRRDFVKNGAAFCAAASLPAILKAKNANDKIGIALIGARRMGWDDLRWAFAAGGVECAAICDVDKPMVQKRADEAAKIQGKRPFVCDDYRKALERKDVDAVIIGTPDHWHCLQACDSLAAGKDVYLEKPIANSIAECDAIVSFAKKYGRVVSVGQQQNSSPMWRTVIDTVKSGKIGRVGKVDVWANYRYGAGKILKPDTPVPNWLNYEMWLGPASYRDFNIGRIFGLWRLYWNYGGGLMTDWGVHLIDMAMQGLNKTALPQSVCGLGGKFAHPETDSETFDTLNVVYDFGDVSMSWSNSAVQIGGFNKPYGVAFYGADAVLTANRDGWEIIPNGKKLKGEKVVCKESERVPHMRDFLDCVRARRNTTKCSIENGSLCAKMAHLGNISARLKKTLSYDDAKKTFNDAVADKLLKPDYRKQWKFPEA